MVQKIEEMQDTVRKAKVKKKKSVAASGIMRILDASNQTSICGRILLIVAHLFTFCNRERKAHGKSSVKRYLSKVVRSFEMSKTEKSHGREHLKCVLK